MDGAVGRGPHATPVSGLVVDGSATAVLCEQSTQAGMLVIRAGDRRGIRIGSTSRTVAAHAACPVVVVNEHEFALAEAAACGAGVTAARVWTPEPPPHRFPAHEHLLRTAAEAATERDILAAAVHGWLDKYPDVDVAQTLIAGDTGPALALLSRTARLVVTAPHRHSRRPGAVSQYLLHHAACPLALAGVSADRTSTMDSVSQR
ncbi:universal stress protein [Phytohabitans rumicis]|uniref:UspA domain-containing protein n=1 Tax=Phytohabitans rumicis TaxID=1076125 RepID=A0A6V8LQV0_9ACTN|nr:universal stress protein [Phytohabitans rumicis]GFJ96666.1 hypothetical protein Prum_103080 [Phytohabitans rumicis]